MKTLFLAMLMAIGIGLAGSGGALAAPASGTGFGSGSGAVPDLQNMIEQTQYRYYRRGHGPRCRNVRVCRGHGFHRRCWWERRCW
jgi:hypothetical protein